MPALLLRDALFYQTRTLYNPETGAKQRAPASYGVGEPERVNGYYANISGHWLAAYAFRGELQMQAERQIFPFDPLLCIDISGQSAHQTMEVWYGDRLEFSITYFLTQLPPSPLATPFAGEESYNFPLFLAHLAADAERQRRLLGEWAAPGV